MHKHRPKHFQDWGYVGPVTTDDVGYFRQNTLAHGCIVQVDTCACGAVRKTNINLPHRERGRWTEPHSKRED